MQHYSLKHVPTVVPVVGVGKEGAYINWSIGLPEQEALVYRATLRTAGPVPILGSERHR